MQPKLTESDAVEFARNLLRFYDNDVARAIQAVQYVATHDLNRSRQLRAEPTTPTVVSIKDAYKTYKLGSQEITALSGVSVDIHEGEFVALTGPSGSGKSTLLQIIGGLDRATSGNVTVDNQNLQELNDRKLSEFRNKTIGFIFQFFYLQPFMKIQANLEVPAVFARKSKQHRQVAAQELAAAVGLTERLDHLPKELSGGQMQRAAIARALMNKPKILLADEPTGNLDQANSAAIMDLFKAVRQQFGTTIIVVTHDQVVANKADREVRLVDGRMVV